MATYSRGSFARPRRIQQILRIDGYLDQGVQTGEGKQIEHEFRLMLAQEQGRRMRLLQRLQSALEGQTLAQTGRSFEIGKPYRFKKKFMTSAGKKLSVRDDSRPEGFV